MQLILTCDECGNHYPMDQFFPGKNQLKMSELSDQLRCFTCQQKHESKKINQRYIEKHFRRGNADGKSYCRICGQVLSSYNTSGQCFSHPPAIIKFDL